MIWSKSSMRKSCLWSSMDVKSFNWMNRCWWDIRNKRSLMESKMFKDVLKVCKISIFTIFLLKLKLKIFFAKSQFFWFLVKLKLKIFFGKFWFVLFFSWNWIWRFLWQIWIYWFFSWNWILHIFFFWQFLYFCREIEFEDFFGKLQFLYFSREIECLTNFWQISIFPIFHVKQNCNTASYIT